jgi:predicted nucleic acid-binding protein
MRAYIDSDVLIWHLRGAAKALRFFEKLVQQPDCRFWIGAMQRAEIAFFMREDERQKTELLLSQFSTAPVTQSTVDAASELYRQWHPSHQLDINDALLAATVMETGGTIYTLNTKHYPMPGVAVERAWK